jgi:hypothetical protein
LIHAINVHAIHNLEIALSLLVSGAQDGLS